jgi:hypothetical protein
VSMAYASRPAPLLLTTSVHRELTLRSVIAWPAIAGRVKRSEFEEWLEPGF